MRHRTLEIFTCVGIFAILASAAFAIGPEDEEIVPPAAEILDAYIEATGGKDAYDRVDNRVTRGTMTVPAQGLALDLTIFAARNGKMTVVLESDATGKIEKGTDGEVVWETSAMMGPQIKEGQEKADFLREAFFDKYVRWREMFRGAETVGIESVGGRPAYEVILTPEDGRPQNLFFDPASKLLVKVEMTIENPMGIIPVETFLEDYREVDGIMLPYTARVVVMGQERVMATESIEQNVDLPEDQFDLPDEIRALLGDPIDGGEAG